MAKELRAISSVSGLKASPQNQQNILPVKSSPENVLTTNCQLRIFLIIINFSTAIN